MSKKEPYALYQTFNCNISKKEPTVAQKKALSESLSNLYEHQKRVFIRLIIEHAEINGSYRPNKIPYGGEESENGDITFNIENGDFPTELKWILIKFIKVCTGESQ